MNASPKTPVRRREYLVAPGEGLILTPDLLQFSERHRQMMDDADLGADDLVASPVSGVPIPQAAKGSDGKLLRWEGVDPAMMWHPFFWLPAEVALRLQLREEGGDSARVETNEEWLLRVLYQIVDVGLFDVESGTWLDVLSMFGIDVEAEGMAERIDNWNSGASDHDLDRVDLTEIFAAVGPNSQLVANILGDASEYVRAQGALSADFLSRSVADLKEDIDRGALLNADQGAAVAMYAMTAHVGFAGTDGLGDTSYLRETLEVFEFVQAGGDVFSALERLDDISARAHADFSPSLIAIASGADAAEEELAAEVAHV